MHYALRLTRVPGIFSEQKLSIDWEATLIIQAKEEMEIGFEVQSRIGAEPSRVPLQSVKIL